MSEHDSDFQALATETNIPTTDADIQLAFDAVRTDQALTITNTSLFSPFWRFVDGIAVQAAKWLVNFLLTTVLPQAFLKTATDVFLDIHAWAVDITRKAAGKAVGVIELTRADTTNELIIPAGFIIQSIAINGNVYSVVTTQDHTFAITEAVIDINVEALTEGAAYNLAEGYYTVMPAPIDGIVNAYNSAGWLTTPGAEREEDDALRDRVRNKFTAVNQWHTNAVYTDIIAQFDGVQTSNIFFDNDAPRGPGTADAFIMLELGTPSDDFIASIQSHITDGGNHGHGDDLLVMAIPESFHDVTCDVWMPSFYTDAQKTELLTNVEQFIRCAFRENTDYTTTKTAPWSLFSFSLLTVELHQAFADISNLDFNIDRIDSEMELPRLGSLAVREFTD